MDAEKSHVMEEGPAPAAAVGLSEDAGQNLKLDQATFFRCVETGNLPALGSLLKNRQVDINAYNDEVSMQIWVTTWIFSLLLATLNALFRFFLSLW
jgi:hypothetical protein